MNPETKTEYAWLVEEIRANQKKGKNVEDSVEAALDNMPDNYLLKPYLIANKAEVKRMCITEYNEERTMRLFKEEAREEGRAEGKAEGKAEERISLLIKKVAKGKSLETIADEMETDPDEIKDLYILVKESAPAYNLVEIMRRAKKPE